VGAPPVSLQYGLQFPCQGGKVAVVDAAVVDLVGEFAEDSRPVPAGRRERDLDLHPPLDDVDGGETRGGSSRLLPRTLPT
jgi:hypothetical protein